MLSTPITSQHVHLCITRRELTSICAPIYQRCLSSSPPAILPSYSPSTRWRNGAQVQKHVPRRPCSLQTCSQAAWDPMQLAYRNAIDDNHSNRLEGTLLAEGLPEEANAIGDRRRSTSTETETHSPLATRKQLT